LYSYSLEVLHDLELFEDDAPKREKEKWIHFLDYRAGLAAILKIGGEDRLVVSSKESWSVKNCKYFNMYYELHNYLLEVLSYLEIFENMAKEEEKEKWFNFLEHRAVLVELLDKSKIKKIKIHDTFEFFILQTFFTSV
jgi:hypothetical protein